MTFIDPIDLHFLSIPESISCYVVRHADGAVLVECGPSSTLPALHEGLAQLQISPDEISDVLLTHIHLDHAGAAGWWARHGNHGQGACIHVHAAGAPHLLNPEKLIASATRIYGERMDTLWGEFLAVPEQKLHIPQDGDILEVGGIRFQAFDTPGHATHHLVYMCQDVCFCGDVAGVRLPGVRHLRLPTPPPEFHIPTWRDTLQKLQAQHAAGKFRRLGLTHFGLFDDTAWHLEAALARLSALETWMNEVMPANPAPDTLRRQYAEWERQEALAAGLEPEQLNEFETASPSDMSADGVARYWKKFMVASAS